MYTYIAHEWTNDAKPKTPVARLLPLRQIVWVFFARAICGQNDIAGTHIKKRVKY